MESIFWWYIGPFLIDMLLFVGGFYSVEGKTVWIICVTGLSLLISIVIYFMNQKATEKEFRGRIEKVDELLLALEERE